MSLVARESYHFVKMQLLLKFFLLISLFFFHRRAGTLTKLEVFINPEKRKKMRRKSCDEKAL
jgi:hypothetical protein